MRKHIKITWGQKIFLLYIVMFAVTFITASTVGKNYIRQRVISESADNMRSVGFTLISTYINQQQYTKTSIRTLSSQLEMVGETTDYRILVICNDGDVTIDTHNESTSYNVYQGDSSFLHKDYVWDTTLDDYLAKSSLCVSLPIEQNAYFNGYVVLAQYTSYIKNRAIYYSNVLFTFYFAIMIIVALSFIILYVFNVRPLRKLQDGVKDFAINRDNKPIPIRSKDEYGELADELNVLGAELSKFDDYQRKFISNISHDIRSPLTSIQGYVQAMADGVIPPESYERYLNIILFETKRLTTLASNLTDINNYGNNNIMLNLSTFDIHESIQKSCESLEVIATESHVALQQPKDASTQLLVQADRDKILQVIHNLLENAIKFSKPDSTIYISTRTSGDKVFVSVKDSGIGIPKEDQTRIWDRFYKTDLSRGKDKMGSGLGLSICKEIINAHKQTIDVVSTVGVGSEFVFTLPKVSL